MRASILFLILTCIFMACNDDQELIEPIDPVIPVACFEMQKDGYKYFFNAECSENAVDYEWNFDAYYDDENNPADRSFKKNPTYTFERNSFGYASYAVKLRVFSKSGNFDEVVIIVTPGQKESSEICTECGCRENAFASIDWRSFCGTEEQVTEYEKDYKRDYCYYGIFEGCRRQ